MKIGTKIKFVSSRSAQIFLPFVLAALLAGCTTEEEKRWEAVEAKDQIEDYKKYLEENPESEFVKEAQSKLKAAYIRKALNENTLDVYKELLMRYPDPGEKIKEILVPTKYELTEDESQTRFRNAYENYKYAIQNNKIALYEDYLKVFANGMLADDLRARLDKIRFVKLIIKPSGDIEAVNAEVEEFARAELEKHGFRISDDSRENPEHVITITASWTTSTRMFTSQSDPKDVRRCISGWRLSGTISLVKAGKNVGIRKFQDNNPEMMLPGVPLFNVGCDNSATQLSLTLSTSEPLKALSEIIELIN